MRGVSSLPPPGLEDAELSGDLKHPLQQALLRAAGQKTVSKLAEDAEVKARVRQLEAEQVLPVDPPRTASAACRSLKPSRNCISVIRARRQGGQAG